MIHTYNEMKIMVPGFFLIGIEGLSMEELIDILVENGVDTIIDIRLKPDHNEMESYVRDIKKHGYDIYYDWMKVFANFFESNDNWAELYDAYLVGMDNELDELYRIIMANRVCILSNTADVKKSHRIMLADRLKDKYGLSYADLNVVYGIKKKYSPTYQT